MKPSPITILDLRDSPWVDGPGRTILQTASMADPERCKILIGGFSGDSHGEHAYLDSAIELGLEAFSITERSTLDYRVARQIHELITRRDVDILHSHDFRSLLYGLYCSRVTGVPLVATCHGWISNNLKGRVYTRIDKFLLRFADHVISVSDTMRQMLLERGFDDAKITVIPNALIIDDYRPDCHDRQFRRELDIADDRQIAVNIGRLSPEKGQEPFILAAHRLLGKGLKMSFVLVGIGPEEARLQALVRELGINEHVVFAGYRKDMTAIYNSADLVVQSSFTEGMPNVILEALLMQVPVIATDVGGTREVAQDKFSAALVPAGDIDMLVDRITDFIDRGQFYRDMALRGCEYVSRHFDHRQRVEKTLQTYERLPAAKRR